MNIETGNPILDAILSEPDPEPETKKPCPPIRLPGSPQRPGDVLNGQGKAIVKGILESHGWTYVNTCGCNERWRRPDGTAGKAKATWSATLRDDGLLYVFSSNAPPLEPGKGYPPFAVYSLLEHGGDFSAAARALRLGSMGEFAGDAFRPVKMEVGEIENPPPLPDGDPESLPLDVHAEPKDQNTGKEWPDPIPIGQIEDLPTFPSEVLPGWLRAMVEGLAESLQTPVDMPGVIGLCVLAAAGARKFRVKPYEGWSEPLNLYTMISLPPAERKSSVIESMAAPLYVHEKILCDSVRATIESAKAAQLTEEARCKELEKRAGKIDGPAERKRITDEIAEIRLNIPPVPEFPRVLVGDVTMEALAKILAGSHGRVALFDAEGGLFETLAGRYSSGVPNLDVLLKSHPGDHIRVDRVGRSHSVMYPALTVGLAVQPDVVQSLTSKESFKGRGLLGRILYSLPRSRLGGRSIEPKPIPDEIKDEYFKKVIELFELPLVEDASGNPTPTILTLSLEAQRLFREFRRSTEKELSPDGRFRWWTDWGGKLCGAVARIAGGIHLGIHGKGAEGYQISEPTMRGAISLGEYFTEHGEAAYTLFGMDEGKGLAIRAVKWMQRKGLETVTVRDVTHFLKCQVEETITVFQILKEHQVIMEMMPDTVTQKKTGRPKGTIYLVNPKLEKI